MLTVITGGSASGKSAYAEDLVLSWGPAQRIYVATMYPFDRESEKRIVYLCLTENEFVEVKKCAAARAFRP